jgi:hypothetical protein
VARDYEQVRRILVAAFDSNDFDSFELKIELLPGEQLPIAAESRRAGPAFRWSKAGVPKVLDGAAVWTVALVLLSSTNRRRGRLMVHRLYSPRNLQIDINLLTATFPTALADALDRTLAHSAQVIPLPEQDSALITAQAG